MGLHKKPLMLTKMTIMDDDGDYEMGSLLTEKFECISDSDLEGQLYNKYCQLMYNYQAVMEMMITKMKLLKQPGK